MPELPGVTHVIRQAIDENRIPGAIVVVRDNGELVHRTAHGVLDAETGYPLRPDTVLWIASLSKVIGCAALLMLADEGRLAIDDLVSRYIPEFAQPGRVRALRPGSPSPFGPPFGPPPNPLPEYDFVAATRELRIRDLLTFTGGLQSIFQWNADFVPPGTGQTLADYVPSLGTLPRDFQAGASWAYSNSASFDVISRIIEIVSDQALTSLLRARIFEPLGIRSAGFGRAGRDGVMPIPPMFLQNPVVEGGTFHSCSAGLWCSAEDYLIFVEMLRRGGLHAGQRLLSDHSVYQMTHNQVGTLCPGLNGREPAPGIGFGLSVATIEDPVAAGEALPARSFGWDGVGTRRFWAAPEQGWSVFFYAPDVGVQREIESAVSTALSE